MACWVSCVDFGSCRYTIRRLRKFSREIDGVETYGVVAACWNPWRRGKLDTLEASGDGSQYWRFPPWRQANT